MRATPVAFISLWSVRINTLLSKVFAVYAAFDPRTFPVLRIMKSIALRFAAFLILTAASTSLLALPYLVGP